ncbi:MAG: Glycosyl transferase family 2 [Microgenomates group bacterium GW2011_GWA2_46_16]|nr:MAG: Glycosyl transferase family 2 [Microgenomates group bacterium GW2011_GWA2_46_16]
MKPLVSVIIVSFNTRKLTVKSIKSAYASQGFEKGSIEVIVVDNHSSDDTVAYLQKNFPHVKLIINSTNAGFGGGNNQGAKVARGKYLLLLNTDAFLNKNSLRVLVDVLEKQANVVSVGPQLRYADNRLQLSGGYLPTPLRVLAWMWWLDKLPVVKQLFSHPYHVFDPSWHKHPQSPEWLMGACVLFRTQEFLEAGGFDNKIFMYAEEVELYRRLQASLGKEVYFTPKTQVTHLGRASSNKANAFVLIHELKGIEYIYQKHYPSLLWFIRFVILVGVALRIIVFSLISSRRESLAEYKKFFERSQ